MLNLLQARTFTELDSWRSLIATRMSPFDIVPRSSSDFFARARLLESAGVRLWDIAASAHRLERSRDLADRSRNTVTLTMQIEGEGGFSQFGREELLHPGDFAFLDWSAPHRRFFHSENRIIVLQLPQAALPQHGRVSAEVLARQLNEGDVMGMHLPEVVQTLFRLWDASSVPSDRAVLLPMMHAVEQMSLKILAAHSGAQRQAAGPTLAELQHHIRQRLTDTMLSPESIAKSHHISLRQLYVLFEDEGAGVSAWIRRERLARVQEDLIDPEVSIAEAGARWGLGSPAQVSRTFRRELGVSPTEFRVHLAREVAALGPAVVARDDRPDHHD